MTSLSFVTVAYNRRDQVKALIESVYASTVVPQEIVVVDNASSDGTVDMLQDEFPGVRVIANRENLLGSRAANQGMATTTGEFVFVTADDNVIDPKMFATLCAAMRALPDAGLVAPVMYYFDAPERIWFAGCAVDLLTGLTRFSFELPQAPYVEATCAPNCYLIRRSVLERIGGLDLNAFPFHHEEADFSLRALAHGFKTYVVRDAREWHRTPVPSHTPVLGSGDYSIDDPNRAYYHARSRALLARRHASAPRRAAFFAVFFPATVAAYFAICLVKSRQHARTSLAFVKGAIDGATMRLPPPPPPLFTR